MITATKIKMQKDKNDSNSLTEIESIYLKGAKKETFYTKESVHDFLAKDDNNQIQVGIAPYPKLLPATSSNGEKYVRSESNSTTTDNLLKLPRE